MRLKYLLISLAHIALGIYLATLIGCAPGYQVAMRDGFDAQWRGYSQIVGDPAQAETMLTVRLIVTQDMGLPGAAGTYSTAPAGSPGTIRVVGKLVDGKIMLCPAVIGHEIMHALAYQDGRFINPDRF